MENKKPNKIKKTQITVEEHTTRQKRLFLIIAFSISSAIIAFLIIRNALYSLGIAIGLFIFFNFYLLIVENLKKAANIKKMEEVFPDFIDLVAANLRAGMTIDKALLLSSRKEFAPLDKEILRVGKDLVTGKEISKALSEMATRIKSEKISKTILLINSGIKAGGNLAVLLEETAANMRERNFVEKRAASNVLMYIIFIFFAAAAGAPALFALSSVLVEILTNILSKIPSTASSTINLPFTLTKINVSVEFITIFSIVFIIITNTLASLVIGLVSKGKEKEGIKYILPLITISLSIFFTARFFLLQYFKEFFR